MTIIETKNPEFGVRIVTCANDETVCGGWSGRDVSPWETEATTAAIREADRVLLDHFAAASESDSFYQHWHGGKWARADIRCGLVVANVFRRDELEVEPGDEPEFSEWEWCGAAALPPKLKAEIEAVLDLANAAAEKELADWEDRAANDRAEC